VNGYVARLSCGWRLGAIGVASGALALVWRGTPIGAFLWLACVICAANGYGAMLGRFAKQHVAFGLRCVSGLACMLVIGTVAARIGILPFRAQVGLVFIGIASNAFATTSPDTCDRRFGGVALLAFAAILLLLAFSVLDLEPPIANGANHLFSVKHLWDTGKLPVVHHQLGSQLVAESLFSLIGGISFVGAFEGELCGALLLLLVLAELRPGRHHMHEITLLVITLAITLDQSFADDEARWSGALFMVAAFVALRVALRDRRVSWHVVAVASALAALRHEYILVAVPYLFAAVVLPRMRTDPTPRACLPVLAGWAVFLVALQVLLAVPLASAVFNAALLLVMVPFTLFAIRALRLVHWNDPLTIALFGALTSFMAVALGAVRPAQHSEGATFAVAFALTTAVLVHLAHMYEAEESTQIARASAVLVLSAFGLVTLVGPSFAEGSRVALVDRFRAAILVARELDARGLDTDAAYHVRLLQDETAPHTSIGFWGQSAGSLDFARNRLRDVSWPASRTARRRERFLSPLTSRSLARLDYLIVEDVPSRPARDPWAPASEAGPGRHVSYPSPLADVDGHLELIATVGAATLYRVRTAR